MPIEQKILAGNCEITTGAFTPTTAMPTFQGENNAVRMEITFFDDGVAYNIPSGVDVRAHLYYAARPAMTQSLQMEVVGNLATLDVSDLFTAVSGTPLMVVRLIDSNGDIQVSCTFGVNVKPTLSGTVIYLLPPSPDEIIYVGRSPYVGNNGNWWTFDNDLHVFVDSGYAATGNYYVFAKWSASAPTQDSDMQDTPSDWIGWYTGPAMTAPSHYTDYVWFLQKGATGATGVSGTNGADGDDGVGIVSVAKTSTVGLVDTYTITYTDATTSTFTVTNGADGADGADGASGTNGTSAYVHIKWSAVNPTQNSDMTDTPSAYIGIYSGTSATAPTAYTSYAWYQYKGETGAAGQGVPTGGTTGQALVKSSATDYATEWAAVGRVNPNLLINSDFANPVNTYGRVSGAPGTFTGQNIFPCWTVYGDAVWIVDTGIYISGSGEKVLQQRLEIPYQYLLGKTVTISVRMSDGTYYKATATFPASVSGATEYADVLISGFATVRVGFAYRATPVRIWDADQSYIPYIGLNGITTALAIRSEYAELGEVSTHPYAPPRLYPDEKRLCSRYALGLNTVYAAGFVYSGSNFGTLPLPAPMRVAAPTLVTLDSYFVCNGASQHCTDGALSSADTGLLTLAQTGSTLTTTYPATWQIVSLVLSAELI